MFNQTKKIVVIGDIILDEFVFGSVDRISPEAPIPILKVQEREFRLGGAANVANNIISLGGDCLLIGRVGKNKQTQILLDQKKIKHNLIIDNSWKSNKKTRFVCSNQQLLRVDEDDIYPITKKDISLIIDFIGDIDIIIISDYAKGVVTKELMDRLRKLNKIILVDPKISKIELFNDVFLLKPNLEETKKVSKINIDDEDELERAAKELQSDYNSSILITRGASGMSLFEKGKSPFHIPTQAREVYDVVGAGDTVIATIGLALASNKNLKDATILANYAAGIVVGKIGTSTVQFEELFSIINKDDKKIKSQKEIIEIVKDLRKKGKKIVFTNGCFDILHIGHTRLLKKAKNFGNILILGLNTDDSIKRIKGLSRPIINEKERAEVMSALECVDYITFFDENEPSKIISEIKPDVHVKGGDYNPNDYDNMPEAKIVHGYGGKVEIISISNGHSSSDIIEKIKKEGKEK